MGGRIHRVTQHPSGMRGVEAMTLYSDHAFPRHTHDQYGIGVMTAGVQTSWSGVGRVESRAGDVIMVNPGEMHDGVPASDAPRGWRIMYFAPELVARELAGERISGDFTIAPVARDRRLAAAVVRLFDHLEHACPDPMAAEESLVQCLMHVALRHRLDRASTAVQSPSVIQAIREIDRAPDAPLSLTGLAAIAGVSRFQLLRGFKREIGTTPHAYVMQRRTRLAREYLSTGHTPSEAAQRAGFADQSHLTREFVRHFGITPGRYRAALQPQFHSRQARADTAQSRV